METLQSHTEEGVAENRTEWSESEMDRAGGGEAGTSQLQFRCKKGHMANIYLTDSEEETIVDFVKDHEELYYKTNPSIGSSRRPTAFSYNQFFSGPLLINL